MRCVCCDSKMSSVDSSRTNPHTGEYEDMCGKCLWKIKETELPMSMRFEDDTDSVAGRAWADALFNRDFTQFEHDFKLSD